MTNIKIDPEFKSLIPPLSVEEYEGLEQNILEDGCRDALGTWRVDAGEIIIDVGFREGEPSTPALVGYRRSSENADAVIDDVRSIPCGERDARRPVLGALRGRETRDVSLASQKFSRSRVGLPREEREVIISEGEERRTVKVGIGGVVGYGQ